MDHRMHRAPMRRRTLLKGLGGLGLAGGLLPRGAMAQDAALQMWWWGEQELPGLQAYLDESIAAFGEAQVEAMLQDTAVVISQFQTAAAAGEAPDIQYLWNGIYHMESVWFGYLRPLSDVMDRKSWRTRTPRRSPTTRARPGAWAGTRSHARLLQ
jgi:ABC-type glycerol-3-phosphate transport system substrate-binding protein